MQPTLTHIALHVRDLEACIRFYESYCGLHLAHERLSDSQKFVWLAERGGEQEFILVLLSGGPGHHQSSDDFSHLGFALGSRAAVDTVVSRARVEGVLVWEPVQEPYPVGYYCGLRDPDGSFVEFSYGQPLHPA